MTRLITTLTPSVPQWTLVRALRSSRRCPGRAAACLWAALALWTATVHAGETVLREDFRSLDDWEALTFPDIERHTSYTAETWDERSVLVARTDASASGLIFNKTFNVYDAPVLRWRWTVDRVFDKGDAREKSGDDYPIRIYVIFEYNPKKAGLGRRLKYGLAKRVYGEYPPDSSLNYIWANRRHDAAHLVSPYTDRGQLIPVDEGDGNVGQWRTHRVHIVDDYREAFGEDPPAKASLAIMSDSDNTGETATGRIDFIELLTE